MSLFKRIKSMLPIWAWISLLLFVVTASIPMGILGKIPENIVLNKQISAGIDSAVEWVVIAGDTLFSTINIVILRGLLKPLEVWLQAIPWWVFSAVATFTTYKVVGHKFGIVTIFLLLTLVVLDLWMLAMSTLALILVATIISIAIGIPVGISASRSNMFDTILRPILDAMQTMPSFVYLIPVLMLFGLGKVPAVIATVIYSVPPIIRLTNLGIRQVDIDVIEAARAFGSTSKQLLFKVQIPLALPTIMAGLNQTIMMALAMVVIASMIGGKGLGVEVLNGIARLDVGRGVIGGIGIVIIAIILDRLTQGFAKSLRAAEKPN